MEFQLDSNLKIKLPTTIKDYPADTPDPSYDITFDDSDDTNFYVDWGDGKCSNITTNSAEAELTHDYSSTHSELDEVTIRIIGTVDNWGSGDLTSYKDLLKKVLNLGDVGWKNLRSAFSSGSLTDFNSGETDTSEVSDMAYFMGGNFSSLQNLNISGLNTVNVRDMSYMFQGLRLIPSIDVSNFNTTNVTDMNGMFSGLNTVTNLDLTNFNTSNVTNMADMFSDMHNLTQINLSSFNTSNVTNMASMFFCNGVSCKLQRLDLSSFDTRNVTNFLQFSENQDDLEFLDISNFNFSSTTDFGLFHFLWQGFEMLLSLFR